MLHQFAYISQQQIAFTDQDLQTLMVHAREKNKRLSLTGLLLYDNGTFLQLLEGPKHAIDLIKMEISADIRHQNMDIIYNQHQLIEREFANWRMGFSILGRHKDKDYLKLDNRIKKLLNNSTPNGQEAHCLLAKYSTLRDAHIHLNALI